MGIFLEQHGIFYNDLFFCVFGLTGMYFFYKRSSVDYIFCRIHWWSV